jgi:hypothetical protein
MIPYKDDGFSKEAEASYDRSLARLIKDRGK